jgi:hypothetical protein
VLNAAVGNEAFTHAQILSDKCMLDPRAPHTRELLMHLVGHESGTDLLVLRSRSQV